VIEWSETQQAVRDMVQKFVEAEIKPKVEELEHGDTPPYDVLRKLFKTFGMDEMARIRFQKQIAREKAQAASGQPAPERESEAGGRGDGDNHEEEKGLQQDKMPFYDGVRAPKSLRAARGDGRRGA